jgi:hypothetical protein
MNLARPIALVVITLGGAACPPPPVPPVLPGPGEGDGGGEGEGEGEARPTRDEIIAAFCGRLEACGNANAVECDAGLFFTFADLDDAGCTDAGRLLEDFYLCALDLSCGALAGPPPSPDEPCGDHYAAADAAIEEGSCFGSCTETLGVRDGCDCGCGVDPDCAGTGCGEPGCSAPGCAFCYDAAGALVTCP